MRKLIAVLLFLVSIILVGCACEASADSPSNSQISNRLELVESKPHLLSWAQCGIVRDTQTGKSYLIVRAISGGVAIQPIE